MSDDDQLDHDLEQMAGNPRVARAMRASLERLQQGAGGPVMAELASDLLAGRTTLREVGRSSAYAEYFREAAKRYDEWRHNLPLDERQELERQAQEEFGAPHQ